MLSVKCGSTDGEDLLSDVEIERNEGGVLSSGTSPEDLGESIVTGVLAISGYQYRE